MRMAIKMVTATFMGAMALLALDQVSAQDWSAPALATVAPADAGGVPTLSVMTYNIEGLPFPLRMGRSDAARHIADRLRAMRAAGSQPHVVVLQEAFGKAQQEIGREAGYRYVAFGPDRDLRSDEPESAADRAFDHGGRMLKGEHAGKWVGSGLAILSDYPIVSVARAAFPAYACAGFDCLANKGMLMAEVQVPGVAAPVAVVATHMNSKNASGVSRDRWNYAFDRQVRSVGLFLAKHLAADQPYVFAGDTNIGGSLPRRAAFEAMLAALPRAADKGVVRTALATCLDVRASCAVGTPVEVRKAYAHGKDWEAYGSGAATAVAPMAVDAPFGHDANGQMLSDHIGYTALYRLSAAS